MSDIQRAALIGLGLMGSALADSLNGSGFEVAGFDVDSERRRLYEHGGGRVAGSPREAVAGVELAITSLPTSDVVWEVCFGPDGIAAGLASGALIIDTTTSRPEDSIALGEQLAELGIGFVDAAISGTSSMVADGDIVIMVGGSEEDVERARPVLDTVSRSVHHMGPVGTGAQAKLVVNLALGVNRIALAEALVFGQALGIDPTSTLDVLRDSLAYSKAMDIWGLRMLNSEFDHPSSRIRQHHKDVRLILAQGVHVGVELPMTTALEEVLQLAEKRGFSASDLSSLFRVLRGEITEEAD